MTYDFDILHHIVETVVSGLSILLNCYLLYLIKNVSTFGVKIYKFLLTVDATLDLCLGLVTFFGQQIGMTGGGDTIIISNGFFSGISSTLDLTLILLWAFLLHTNILWIAVQFIYRYLLLCTGTLSSRVHIVIGSVVMVYSMIAVSIIVLWCQISEEFQPNGERVLDVNNWTRHHRIFFTGTSIRDWRMAAWLSLWTSTCIGSIIIVIWCEKKIMRCVGSPTTFTTQKMHKEFHRALLAMAICPLVSTTVPLFYYIFTISFQLRSGKISAMMTTATTCITLFNPLTTILFLRSYLQVSVKIICSRCQSRVNPQEATA